ncbi:hypothetical protein K701_18000 [Streptomyces fradiae ATCC 10745 = DSM 40063]|uniref:Uncharacterized protein n=1 Tax=Streptomyces fradiae ATCC 10745 = DSM 40063 TaxID=1319510 RepID=A0ABQ6XRV7_STRFR|nr:hypothetical protein K701_18000 [Streptomyces fradiae ATCC 10745 = DSM 40063]QEV11844.1 hypothetical protein CP974_07200 [Streptomyces fradiae ATCC 10745 = DSM 40063]
MYFTVRDRGDTDQGRRAPAGPAGPRHDNGRPRGAGTVPRRPESDPRRMAGATADGGRPAADGRGPRRTGGCPERRTG